MKRFLFVCMAIAIGSLYAMAQQQCDKCDGTGKEHRPCAFCGGEGKRECDFCLGKKYVRCNDCGGSGEVFCAHCNGRGGVQIKDEWRECQWCGGKGTPDCQRCGKTGSIVCWKCEGAGEYVCNQCNGSKVNEWSCTKCGGTGQIQAETVTSTFKDNNGYSGTVQVQIDPNDSFEEKARKLARARVANRMKQMQAQGITVK